MNGQDLNLNLKYFKNTFIDSGASRIYAGKSVMSKILSHFMVYITDIFKKYTNLKLYKHY